jgi:DUF177 domain-containing protein
MLISLQQLEHRPVPFEVDVPAEKLEYDGKLTQASVLHAKGTARLVSRSLGEIRIEGHLTVSMNAECDRCLEGAVVPLDRSFDLMYVPAEDAAASGEDEVDEAGIEVGYYEGQALELNDVLREVVLLALPMRVVCSDDCKGICPLCGQNRNQKNCDCRPVTADDRWNKLKSLKSEIGLRN